MEVMFSPGQIVATPGAMALLDKVGRNGSDLLSRHLQGDWGDVCKEDAAQNNQALEDGERLLSSYEFKLIDKKIWIITEHDRSVTTILLPEEY